MAVAPTIGDSYQTFTNNDGKTLWKSCFVGRGTPTPIMSVSQNNRSVEKKTAIRDNFTCFEVACCQQITVTASNCFGNVTQTISVSGRYRYK